MSGMKARKTLEAGWRRSWMWRRSFGFGWAILVFVRLVWVCFSSVLFGGWCS
jgi:hypothetical protein